MDDDNERSQVPTTSMPDSGPRSVVDISDKSCEVLGPFFRVSQGRQSYFVLMRIEISIMQISIVRRSSKVGTGKQGWKWGTL